LHKVKALKGQHFILLSCHY